MGSLQQLVCSLSQPFNDSIRLALVQYSLKLPWTAMEMKSCLLDSF